MVIKCRNVFKTEKSAKRFMTRTKRMRKKVYKFEYFPEAKKYPYVVTATCPTKRKK